MSISACAKWYGLATLRKAATALRYASVGSVPIGREPAVARHAAAARDGRPVRAASTASSAIARLVVAPARAPPGSPRSRSTRRSRARTRRRRPVDDPVQRARRPPRSHRAPGGERLDHRGVHRVLDVLPRRRRAAPRIRRDDVEVTAQRRAIARDWRTTGSSSRPSFSVSRSTSSASSQRPSHSSELTQLQSTRQRTPEPEPARGGPAAPTRSNASSVSPTSRGRQVAADVGQRLRSPGPSRRAGGVPHRGHGLLVPVGELVGDALRGEDPRHQPVSHTESLREGHRLAPAQCDRLDGMPVEGVHARQLDVAAHGVLVVAGPAAIPAR